MAKDHGAIVSQKGYDVKTCADRFLIFSTAFQTLKVHSTYAISTTIPNVYGDDFGDIDSVNTGTDVITTDDPHLLSNGDKIVLWSSGTLPGGLDDETIYYIINKTADTFKLSLTQGGSAVNITSAGTGFHEWESAPNRITISHNIGTLAPFITIYNGSSGAGVANSYFQCDGGGAPLGDKARNFEDDLIIDVYNDFDAAASNAGDTVYFSVYLFLDDFSTMAEENINSSLDSGSFSNDYGIRISKEGFDVKTCADIDCVLSSAFFNQIVHKKGSTTGTSVSHNLGYAPNYLIYSRYSGYDYIFLNDDSSINSDDSGIYFAGSSTKYYIIFKDKLD